MSDTITGACLCGACRYHSDAPVMNVRACHCRRCQRATGSPFYARVMVPLASVTIDGPVAWYDGDTGVRRGFCPACSKRARLSFITACISASSASVAVSPLIVGGIKHRLLGILGTGEQKVHVRGRRYLRPVLIRKGKLVLRGHGAQGYGTAAYRRTVVP